MSLQELATTPQAAEPVKHRRISKRIRTACAALVDGDAKTVTEAAKIANLTRTHLSHELSKPHIAEYLKLKACRALAMGAARAAAVKGELMESASDHVRNDVSTYVLALAGIKPASSPQVSVNIELKAGYVIDLTDAASMPHTHTIEGNALKSQDDV